MEKFKKKLKEMGFNRKSPRVFWYDNNGLFYVVSFKVEKTENGEEFTRVGFEVSHAGMFEGGVPAQRRSPVGGWACSDGVCNNARYHNGEAPDGVFLERMVKEYFSYFKDAIDWKTAIVTLGRDDWAKENAIDAGVGGMIPSWFINGEKHELKTDTEFMKSVNALFERNFIKYGFRFLEEHDVYVRKRGALYDCLDLRYDDASTFFLRKPMFGVNNLQAMAIGLLLQHLLTIMFMI